MQKILSLLILMVVSACQNGSLNSSSGPSRLYGRPTEGAEVPIHWVRINREGISISRTPTGLLRLEPRGGDTPAVSCEGCQLSNFVLGVLAVPLASLETLPANGIVSGEHLADVALRDDGSFDLSEVRPPLDHAVVLSLTEARGATSVRIDYEARHSGQVLVILPGDLNLDGIVDTEDFEVLRSVFNNKVSSWFSGDYNLDGEVDLRDFGILKSNLLRCFFQKQ